MQKFPFFIHGADYNPDQWLNYPGIIDEDFRLLRLANMNSLSVGIFAWAKLEPEEGIYDFAWLDDIFQRMNKHGGKIVLATPSGARPQWLAKKYPEVLRTNERREKAIFGRRHNHCYTSPLYREKVTNINGLLAKRYSGNPALFLWHLSNEYGGECHCELCNRAFREWIKRKYDNDLDKLNDQYWAGFWSHSYTDWEQVESPSSIGETSVHALNLDWKRFVTHQTIDFMKTEIEAVRKYTPDVPVTTNLMGYYPGLDYRKLAKEIDIVSWDSYPRWGRLDRLAVAVETAFNHDLMRSCGGGKPFMLMECTPSIVNHHPVNMLKRPGNHMLASLQAVAHGSDSIQYFQFRKSRGSSEKLHGAVVDHCGHENTRVFRDVAEVGKTLKGLGEITGSVVNTETAIIFDWENRWALNDSQGLTNTRSSNPGESNYDPKKYLSAVLQHYKCFWEQGINVDIIGLEDDYSKYKTIVAPMLYMLGEKDGKRLAAFVKNGGTLVTTYFSGVVNENDLVHLKGLPGAGLGEVLGIWAEEIDALWDDQYNLVSAFGSEYRTGQFCEIAHLRGAEALGEYKTDFYAGSPALTKNKYGNGTAYYIAFLAGDDFLRKLYAAVIREHGVRRNLDVDLSEGVSVRKRSGAECDYFFIQNFLDEPKRVALERSGFTDPVTGANVSGPLELKGYGSCVLKRVR